jgi:hypothetical protein
VTANELRCYLIAVVGLLVVMQVVLYRVYYLACQNVQGLNSIWYGLILGVSKLEGKEELILSTMELAVSRLETSYAKEKLKTSQILDLVKQLQLQVGTGVLNSDEVAQFAARINAVVDSVDAEAAAEDAVLTPAPAPTPAPEPTPAPAPEPVAAQ